jgi:hypothetical protein
MRQKYILCSKTRPEFPRLGVYAPFESRLAIAKLFLSYLASFTLISNLNGMEADACRQPASPPCDRAPKPFDMVVGKLFGDRKQPGKHGHPFHWPRSKAGLSELDTNQTIFLLDVRHSTIR